MGIEALQQMKRDGRKIVAVVVYDYQMAQIVDRAGVDLVSVGDSVGKMMWGQESELDVTLEQMLLACKAVRKGVTRALVSCDLPYGPVQQGSEAAIAAARRLMQEGGADIVKVDAAAEFPDAVRAMVRSGIPVWAQFGVTPHTAGRLKPAPTSDGTAAREKAAPTSDGTDVLVAQAKLLESLGVPMLDFTHSGPVAGPAVTQAVSIPVIGGLGGGPWLDGRVRAIGNAVGYLASALDDTTVRYANVAKLSLDALKTYADDVRASRQVLGDPAGSTGSGLAAGDGPGPRTAGPAAPKPQPKAGH
jgi:3-methyl-2-oxobutanoate hydroxymethyltransferase